MLAWLRRLIVSVGIARQGFSGHHYVIMALCSVVASFLVNALFAFATKPRGTLSPAQLAVASENDRRNPHTWVG